MSPSPTPVLTLRRVRELLGVSRGVVESLVDAGFVEPSRGPRNQLQFSFQDVTLLRTARALQAGHIPVRRIVRSLAHLRASLPNELPMTGLRITAIGAEVAVTDRDGTSAAITGQLLMDFEIEPRGSSVAIFEGRAASQPEKSPRQWLDEGEALEAAAPASAEAAYRKALDLSPRYIDAYLNLGALLCETHRCDDAVDLYELALRQCEPSALLYFNQAIALEDQHRDQEAIASYEQVLALEPTLADAHFNLARIQERLGDAKGALQHFNAYRRLHVLHER